MKTELSLTQMRDIFERAALSEMIEEAKYDRREKDYKADGYSARWWNGGRAYRCVATVGRIVRFYVEC